MTKRISWAFHLLKWRKHTLHCSVTLYYDGKKLKYTNEYISAIKNLMRAEILMLRKNHLHDKEYWVCGITKIEDLSSSKSITTMFGSKKDRYWLKEEGDIMESYGSGICPAFFLKVKDVKWLTHKKDEGFAEIA